MDTQRIKRTVIAFMVVALILTAFWCSNVQANGVPSPSPNVSQTQGQGQGQHQGQGQDQAATASASQTSGLYGGNSRYYALPFSSGSAAPLPPGICPQGDSLYWQVLFGVFTWSTSSTRTEGACLEKWSALLAIQSPAPTLPPLAPSEDLHPINITVAPSIVIGAEKCCADRVVVEPPPVVVKPPIKPRPHPKPHKPPLAPPKAECCKVPDFPKVPSADEIRAIVREETRRECRGWCFWRW